MAFALIHAEIRPAPDAAADAVLVRDGRIERVGSTAEVLAATTPEDTIVDLAGGWLIPGLQDAHSHFMQQGILARRPSLAQCTSLDDFSSAIAAALRDRPGTDLVTFEEWDETMWDHPIVPTRATLDAIDRRRPILARRVCGHLTVANTPALAEIAALWSGPGIEAESGHLVEEPSLHLDEMLLSDADEAIACLKAADSLYLARGITTACDFLRPSLLPHWIRWLEEGGGQVRVNAYLLEECFDDPELVERAGAERFTVRGLKIYADGTIGGRTASVYEDYSDRPGGRGAMLIEPEDLRRSVRRAHDAGWSVAIHAIGDRTIDEALKAFEALGAEQTRGRGHRIEHVEMPRDADFERLRTLDVRPCVQPNFLQWAAPGGLYETALGSDRLSRMNPIRTFLDHECHPFFGSDGMPTSGPFGLRHAMNHPVEAERVSFDEALLLYPAAAADAVPGHVCPGRIEPGAPADLAVFADRPDRLPDLTEAELTVVDGQIIHSSEGLERARSG